MIRRVVFFVSTVVAIVSLAAWLVLQGYWTPWARGVSGIDISHHQGKIDWTSIDRRRAQFVWMKATEGGDSTDPRFKENWATAMAAGIPRGAYHFFTLCRPGEDQAAHFISVVGDLEGDLIPVVDLEHMGPCRDLPQTDDPAREARAFLDTVEAHYGVRPIIYTTQEFHDAYLKDFQGERFWLRSLFSPPEFRKDWSIWQHHNRARLSGFDRPVDLNVLSPDVTIDDMKVG